MEAGSVLLLLLVIVLYFETLKLRMFVFIISYTMMKSGQSSSIDHRSTKQCRLWLRVPL